MHELQDQPVLTSCGVALCPTTRCVLLSKVHQEGALAAAEEAAVMQREREQKQVEDGGEESVQIRRWKLNSKSNRHWQYRTPDPRVAAVRGSNTASRDDDQDTKVAEETRMLEAREPEVCSQCRMAFTVVNRRHHCRLCLQVLCDTCSPQRLVRHWDSPTSNSDTDISAAAAADGEASNAAAGQQAGGMPVAATASADASVSTTTSSIITSGDDMASIRVQQHAEYKLKADPRSRWGERLRGGG